MCQICTESKEVTGRGRWPKPLEKQLKEYLDLMPTAHAEVTAFTTQNTNQATSSTSTSTTKTTSSEKSNAPPQASADKRKLTLRPAPVKASNSKTSSITGRQSRPKSEKGRPAKNVGPAHRTSKRSRRQG